MNYTKYQIFQLLSYVSKLEELKKNRDLILSKRYVNTLRQKYLNNTSFHDYIKIKSYINLLPTEVIIYILQKLDHISLIEIGLAYPSLIGEVITQKLWKKLNIYFNFEEFNSIELNQLLIYLNNDLQKLMINLSNIDNNIIYNIEMLERAFY
jgi:hypothetical protein